MLIGSKSQFSYNILQQIFVLQTNQPLIKYLEGIFVITKKFGIIINDSLTIY